LGYSHDVAGVNDGGTTYLVSADRGDSGSWQAAAAAAAAPSLSRRRRRPCYRLLSMSWMLDGHPQCVYIESACCRELQIQMQVVVIVVVVVVAGSKVVQFR
jgi:hypothetical protein